MKKFFAEPEIEVLNFTAEDVLTVSGDPDVNAGEEQPLP